MILTILSTGAFIAILGGSTVLYKKRYSKKACKKKEEQKRQKLIELVNKLTLEFNNAYSEYMNKNEELKKLQNTRKLWFDSAEEDPTARENLRDVDMKIVIIDGRIKYKTSVLNFIVREIMDEPGVIDHIRKNNFDLYRKAVLWNTNHKSEIEDIQNNK